MTVPTLDQMLGQPASIAADVLSFDLAATPLDTAEPITSTGLFSYLLLNMQTNQVDDPAALFQVTESTPIVTTRGGESKTRYRYTVDFYADPQSLDPATI